MLTHMAHGSGTLTHVSLCRTQTDGWLHLMEMVNVWSYMYLTVYLGSMIILVAIQLDIYVRMLDATGLMSFPHLVQLCHPD